MRLAGIVLFLGCLAIPSILCAEESYLGMEYISGRAGLDKKVKGTLVVADSELRFVDREGKTLIAIPMKIIKEVSNSIEQDPGSTGKKMLLGVFASKKEEFLYVTTETPEKAEGLVFKCKSKTSPGIITKIQFQMKKQAQATSAPQAPSAPDTTTTPQSPDSTKK